VGRAGVREMFRVTRLPGTPAFWSAFGGPAAQRRTIGVVARWFLEGLRPRRWHADGLLLNWNRCTGRRLPGSAIVWIVLRCRKVVPAQWRARHAPVSGVSHVLGCGFCLGYGCGTGLGYGFPEHRPSGPPLAARRPSVAPSAWSQEG